MSDQLKYSGKIIGLDVGDARIGVALSDPTGLIATPMQIVDRKAADPVQVLVNIIRETAVHAIVIGLPRNMDGTEGTQALRCRKFAGHLTKALPDLPVHFQDERRTSSLAASMRLDRGAKKSQRRQKLDAEAAALILQAWLDHHRTHHSTSASSL